MSKYDLTGQTFGRWTVLKRADDHVTPSGSRCAQWLCKCSCDKHTIRAVSQNSLIKGLSKSCGCLRKEIASKTNKKYNKYEFHDDYVIGYTNNNTPFYVDIDDYEIIKDYCWHENDNRCGYIMSKELDNCRKNIYMHRLIMKCNNSDIFVDHINHNVTDNRKKNLRLVTAAQNTYNKSIQPYNTSGNIGVYYNKRRKEWVAQIVYNGKHICKYCKTEDDAIKKRAELEDKYFGEYGYKNSMCIGG